VSDPLFASTPVDAGLRDGAATKGRARPPKVGGYSGVRKGYWARETVAKAHRWVVFHSPEHLAAWSRLGDHESYLSQPHTEQGADSQERFMAKNRPRLSRSCCTTSAAAFYATLFQRALEPNPKVSKVRKDKGQGLKRGRSKKDNDAAAREVLTGMALTKRGKRARVNKDAPPFKLPAFPVSVERAGPRDFGR